VLRRLRVKVHSSAAIARKPAQSRCRTAEVRIPKAPNRLTTLPHQMRDTIFCRMQTRQNYKEYVVEAHPTELPDGESWTGDVKIQHLNRLDVQFSLDRKFRTRDEVIGACISAGKDRIDFNVEVENILAIRWNEGPIPGRLGSVDIQYKNGEHRKYEGDDLAWVVPQIDEERFHHDYLNLLSEMKTVKS
jgi:hypothetical protein